MAHNEQREEQRTHAGRARDGFQTTQHNGVEPSTNYWVTTHTHDGGDSILPPTFSFLLSPSTPSSIF